MGQNCKQITGCLKLQGLQEISLDFARNRQQAPYRIPVLQICSGICILAWVLLGHVLFVFFASPTHRDFTNKAIRNKAEMLTDKERLSPIIYQPSVSYVRCSAFLEDVLLRLLQTYKVLMLKGLQKRHPAHHFGILVIFELEVWRTSRHRKGCLTSHLLPKSRSSNSDEGCPPWTRKIRCSYWCRANLYKPPARMNWIIH